MCDVAVHTVKSSRFNALAEQRRDPTRTTVQRERYAREMRKRFTRLRSMIHDAIITKDIFGIKGGHEGTQSNIKVYVDSGLSERAFQFRSMPQKVSLFMEWLESQVQHQILEVSNKDRIGQSIDESWQNVFLEDTYKRGVQRATYEMNKAQFPGVQSVEQRGGMQAIMGLPMHADRLGVLYTRAYTDLKGITEAMDQQISRVLTQGMADGDGPRDIARKINATIGGRGATPGKLGLKDTLGRFIPAQRRAEMLARTEIIRAHHQGMMQEYRNYGLEGVVVQAEFRTAGDDRVCLECEGLENTVYTLDEAQNLIPVHPLCRCIMLPARPQDVEAAAAARASREVEAAAAEDSVSEGLVEVQQNRPRKS